MSTQEDREPEGHGTQRMQPVSRPQAVKPAKAYGCCPVFKLSLGHLATIPNLELPHLTSVYLIAT